MKTIWKCIATVEYKNGSTAFKTWRGTRGAAKLKSAMRAHFKIQPDVTWVGLGNCFSVNSYGAH